MPRDAFCVHSEARFAVTGLKPEFLGSQRKAGSADTTQYIPQFLQFPPLFSFSQASEMPARRASRPYFLLTRPARANSIDFFRDVSLIHQLIKTDRAHKAA